MIFKDFVEWASFTDPARFQPQPDTPGTCPVFPEPTLKNFVTMTSQYFLPPGVTVDEAEEFGNVSPFKPLIRSNP